MDERIALGPIDHHPIFTIGHVALPIGRFIGLLQQFEVTVLADIRRFPGSRSSPQFDQNALRDALGAAGIGYVHLEKLGGRRRPRPDSPNSAWRNESFRGYADYMETTGFREGLRALTDLARHERVAIMCAEAVWWRCHRRIIADYLLFDGDAVFHIMGHGRIEPATPTPAARRQPDGSLRYQAPDPPSREPPQ